MEWAFGINSTVPNCVHLLENNAKNQEIIFYPVSNNGVIYNMATKKQQFLLQHTNIITSAILSPDKQFIILGDSGASNNNSMITIWSGTTYELLSVYKLPTNFGVQSLSINPTSNLLTAIVNESVPAKYDSDSNQIQHRITQHLIVWALAATDNFNDEDIKSDTDSLTAEEDPHKIEVKLLAQHKVKSQRSPDEEVQLHHFVAFNHDSTEIVTHGASMEQFIFWTLPQHDAVDELRDIELTAYYVLSTDNINNCDLSAIGALTASCFIPKADGSLITGTNNGDLIYWDYDTKKMQDFDALPDDNALRHRVVHKVINKVTRGSINCVDILPNNDIIVMASSSGSVRFYDFQCRVIGWLDYLGDQVTSISFPKGTRTYSHCFGTSASKSKSNENAFNVPSMMIGTKHHKIIKVESTDNGQGDAELTTNVVVETFNTVCTAMSAHPVLPMVAVGNGVGEIQIWEIIQKTKLQSIALPQPQTITVEPQLMHFLVSISCSLNGDDVAGYEVLVEWRVAGVWNGHSLSTNLRHSAVCGAAVF